MTSINPGMHSRVKANLESLLTRGRADTRAGAHTRKLTPILGTACTDLNSLCYNSITEQGQMFWIAAARGRYGSKFDVLSMLSISPGISIDPVETVESGEMVDSNNRQQTCGFGANLMKIKWGRISVG